MGDEILIEIMKSLSCVKNRILVKTGEPKVIATNNIFKVIPKFKSKLKFLTLNPPMIKETFNRAKVARDRSHAIEAAIVKIMKSRKKMNQMHLFNEVLAQLNVFKPTLAQVKER